MLYIKLFHGRTHICQELEDWGLDGPIFGPYDCIHTTYAGHLKMSIQDKLEELFVVNDMLFYGDLYYGDWSIFSADKLSDEEEAFHQCYKIDKSVVPSLSHEQHHPVKIVAYIRGGICQDVKCNLADADWEYVVADYDNDPDLNDDQIAIGQSRIIPLIPHGHELAMAAKDVVENWPTSNLAASVRKLDGLLQQILPGILGK